MEYLTDIHCHLHEPDFCADLDGVINRALSAGVGRFVCNSGSIDDLAAVNDIAQKYDSIIPCFGIHPWFVADLPENWLNIVADYASAAVSGIGEIGLDGWKKNIPPLEEQIPVFKAQLDLARQLNRPVMIHCLKAYDQLFDILKNDGPPQAGFLMHAYSGSWTMVQPLADLGGYFSFSHAILSPERKKAHKTITAVPSDRILMESDSPDLVGPEPFRPYSIRRADGRFRQEPANIAAAAKGFADIRNQPADDFISDVMNNTDSFLSHFYE